MVVRIYIWDQAGGNVGHASIKLGNGTHISWWPKDDKNKTSMKRNPVCISIGKSFTR